MLRDGASAPTTDAPALHPAAVRSARRADVLSMLTIGAIGFGGGSALIPVFEHELVVRRRRLTPQVFAHQTIVASITPGALPVKLGALAGAAVSGARHALTLALVVAVPGVVATIALLAAVGSSTAAVRTVERASVGISAFIIAVLVHYVVTLVTTSRHRLLSVGILTAAFLASGAGPALTLVAASVGVDWKPGIPRLSAIQVIAVALGLVLVRAAVRRASGSRPQGGRWEPGASEASGPRVWPAVLLLLGAGLVALLVVAVVRPGSAALLGLVGLSTVTSFGGGEAYVAVADAFFVGGGYVSPEAFYGQLVPIANALPGPILVKLAAATGYQSAVDDGGSWVGIVVAVAAAVVAISVCTAIAMAVMGAYDRARRSQVVAEIGTVVLPVIGGLLVSTSVSMLMASTVVGARDGVSVPGVLWASIAGIASLSWARHRAHDVLLVVLSGGLAVLALGWA